MIRFLKRELYIKQDARDGTEQGFLRALNRLHYFEIKEAHEKNYEKFKKKKLLVFFKICICYKKRTSKGKIVNISFASTRVNLILTVLGLFINIFCSTFFCSISTLSLFDFVN